MVIVIDEAQYAIKRDPEFVKSILKLKMKRLYPGPVMIILASSSIVWATQDAKDAFGDGFRRIDVLHKVEDLNFLEVVRTFPHFRSATVSVFMEPSVGCRDLWKHGIRKFHTGRIFTGLC